MGFFERLGKKAESLRQTAESGREDEVVARCADCGEDVYTERETCPNCGSDHLGPLD